MPLRENMESSGAWLFRWRSFLPLLLIAPILFAFKDYQYPYQSHRADQIWEMVCLSIALLGLGIRFITVGSIPKGTSGRNTKRIKGGSLNTTGVYSIVRHPLYLGNFIITIGIALFFRTLWLTSLSVLIFWLYYERIIFAEEEFLRTKFGENYFEWANKTPTFLPKFQNWIPPALPFSFRTALRKEYRTFMGIVAVFTFLETLGNFFLYGTFICDWLWVVFFSFGASTFFVVRTLDTKSNLLKIEGR